MTIKKGLLFIMMAIVLLSLSSCSDDSIPLEKQESEVIDDFIELNKTLNLTGNSTDEYEKEEDVNENETEPALYSDDEPFKSREMSPRTFRVELDGLDEGNTKTQVLALRDLADIYVENRVIAKVEIRKVPNTEEVWISINNERANIYSEEDIIEVKEPYYFTVSDILHNDDGGNYLSVIQLDFFVDIKEKYPSYLVEKDLGLNDYISSEQRNDDTYIARYSSTTVTVEKDEDFTERYLDKSKIIEYKDSRLYKLDEEGVAWVSFIQGTEYVITIPDNAESVIDSYLEKFPSFISKKTFCEASYTFEEKEEAKITYNGVDIEIEVFAIVDSTLEALLFIDGKERRVDRDDTLKINNEITAIIDEIDIDYQSTNDRISVCFV